jgi:hypothetical protein
MCLCPYMSTGGCVWIRSGRTDIIRSLICFVAETGFRRRITDSKNVQGSFGILLESFMRPSKKQINRHDFGITYWHSFPYKKKQCLYFEMTCYGIRRNHCLTQYSNIASNARTTGGSWIRKYLKGSGFVQIGELSWCLPRGAEESHENPVRIADIPDKIGTKHFPNKNLESYRYTFCSVRMILIQRLTHKQTIRNTSIRVCIWPQNIKSFN